MSFAHGSPDSSMQKRFHDHWPVAVRMHKVFACITGQCYIIIIHSHIMIFSWRRMRCDIRSFWCHITIFWGIFSYLSCVGYQKITASQHDVWVIVYQQVSIKRLLCHLPVGPPIAYLRIGGPTGNMHRCKSVSMIIGSLPLHYEVLRSIAAFAFGVPRTVLS